MIELVTSGNNMAKLGESRKGKGKGKGKGVLSGQDERAIRWDERKRTGEETRREEKGGGDERRREEKRWWMFYYKTPTKSSSRIRILISLPTQP